MKQPSSVRTFQRAFTLIEALVASSVLIMGIAAASTMSLAFVTQEEIAERSLRSFNYLDNAIALYQVGFDPSEIVALLPKDPAVKSLTINPGTMNIPHYKAVPSARFTLTWKANPATENSGLKIWTGGKQEVERQVSVDVIRTETTGPGHQPRADFFN